MFLQLKLYIFRFMKKSEWHQIWEKCQKIKRLSPHQCWTELGREIYNILHSTYLYSKETNILTLTHYAIHRLYVVFWRQVATEGRRVVRWLEVERSPGQRYWQSSWGQSPHSRGTSCRAPQSLSEATSRNLILHWISGSRYWYRGSPETVPHNSQKSSQQC